MNDPNSEPDDSLLPKWLRGERQTWIIQAILWAVAATISWLNVESLAETGHHAVVAVFGALALYYFAMAVFADRATLEKQARTCRWSWGW